jgi:colicin import membrane protein
MQAQYIQMIRLDVESAWRQPPGSAVGQSCVVNVTQAGSGDVIAVQVRSCSGTDAFQKSVERAVWRASPLPFPPDPELFSKELEFIFTP